MRTLSTTRILILVLFGVLFVNSVCSAQVRASYAWSENSTFGVRIIPGWEKKKKSRATVLKFNEATKGLDCICEFDLAIDYVPFRIFVANNGRHLVTMGNQADTFEQKRNAPAISIFDLDSGKHVDFTLAEMFSKHNLVSFPEYQNNYQIVLLPIVINEETHQILMTGYNRDKSVKRPDVVVDYSKMTVTIQRPSFWKKLYDKKILQFDQMDSIKTAVLTVEQVQLSIAAIEASNEPEIVYKAIGDDVVFRQQPGDGTQNASELMMRHNPVSNGFDLVRVIELRNSVAPEKLTWLISRDCKYMITFDEFNSVGKSANAIVIYHLETGKSRAFALEDFCESEDLENMATAKNVRLWRFGMPWITFTDQSFLKLFDNDGSEYLLEETYPGLLPHLVIDVEKMEVRLMEPFRSKYLHTRLK